MSTHSPFENEELERVNRLGCYITAGLDGRNTEAGTLHMYLGNMSLINCKAVYYIAAQTSFLAKFPVLVTLPE